MESSVTILPRLPLSKGCTTHQGSPRRVSYKQVGLREKKRGPKPAVSANSSQMMVPHLRRWVCLTWAPISSRLQFNTSHILSQPVLTSQVLALLVRFVGHLLCMRHNAKCCTAGQVCAVAGERDTNQTNKQWIVSIDNRYIFQRTPTAHLPNQLIWLTENLL